MCIFAHKCYSLFRKDTSFPNSIIEGKNTYFEITDEEYMPVSILNAITPTIFLVEGEDGSAPRNNLISQETESDGETNRLYEVVYKKISNAAVCNARRRDERLIYLKILRTETS